MPQLLSTKNLLVSTKPLVVGVINTPEILASFQTHAEPESLCDVIELRLDSINLPTEELRAQTANLPLPVLLTARHPEEGGDHQLSPEQRLQLLRDHLDIATLVDVELRSAQELHAVIQEAQHRGIGVIGSYHDFHATPANDILQGAVDFANQFKFDAVKIATTLRHAEDLARLIQILHQNAGRRPLCLMGMGPLGALSRLTLGRCGSLLNYGFLGEPNAPGQIAAAKLKQWLKEI